MERQPASPGQQEKRPESDRQNKKKTPSPRRSKTPLLHPTNKSAKVYNIHIRYQENHPGYDKIQKNQRTRLKARISKGGLNCEEDGFLPKS